MWIVRIALSRPYSFVVLALLLFLIAPFTLLRTPVDIFPVINVPVVSIMWTGQRSAATVAPIRTLGCWQSYAKPNTGLDTHTLLKQTEKEDG